MKRLIQRQYTQLATIITVSNGEIGDQTDVIITYNLSENGPGVEVERVEHEETRAGVLVEDIKESMERVKKGQKAYKNKEVSDSELAVMVNFGNRMSIGPHFTVPYVAVVPNTDCYLSETVLFDLLETGCAIVHTFHSVKADQDAKR